MDLFFVLWFPSQMRSHMLQFLMFFLFFSFDYILVHSPFWSGGFYVSSSSSSLIHLRNFHVSLPHEGSLQSRLRFQVSHGSSLFVERSKFSFQDLGTSHYCTPLSPYRNGCLDAKIFYLFLCREVNEIKWLLRSESPSRVLLFSYSISSSRKKRLLIFGFLVVFSFHLEKPLLNLFEESRSWFIDSELTGDASDEFRGSVSVLVFSFSLRNAVFVMHHRKCTCGFLSYFSNLLRIFDIFIDQFA